MLINTKPIIDITKASKPPGYVNDYRFPQLVYFTPEVLYHRGFSAYHYY
jgi:hypothetical protein